MGPKDGIDRYCIDLICMAGAPSLSDSFSDSSSSIASGNNLADSDTGIISASEFNATSYESSAEDVSGKYLKTKERLILAASIILPIAAFAILVVPIYATLKRNCLPEKNDDKKVEAKLSAATNSDKESPTKTEKENPVKKVKNLY